MGAINLTKDEDELVKAVEHGSRATFKHREPIRAEVLRHIILGLPLLRIRVGVRVREVPCARTGAGISIVGAVITDGPLELGGATGDDGGPLCPLEFEQCRFDGGFRAAHAHFSRLGLRNCQFRDLPDPPDPPGAVPAQPVPTIDLAGAWFDSGVTLRAITPDRPADHLWIRAAGARIPGLLDLSLSVLVAPADDRARRMTSEPPVAAIDLERAEIGGDLRLLNGVTCTGRIHAPGLQVRGDVRLSGASIHIEEKENKAEEEAGLNLQSARIGGMLILDDRRPAADRKTGELDRFSCNGAINLRAAEIGDDLHIEAGLTVGNLDFLDLTVGNDLLLYATVLRKADLSGCRIGGSLDLSRFTIKEEPGKLLLSNGVIQRRLRLVRDDYREEDPSAVHRSDFAMKGVVDLSGLTCDLLDDDVGTLWRPSTSIRMHNFIYRQTGSRPEEHKRKRSNRIVGDWVSRRRADGLWPWRWVPKGWLPGQDFWESWQRRRNWIYQQFDSPAIAAAIADPSLSMSRHDIEEGDYHPQPFEQAIRVARAEGREDFATNIEILKQRLEWRFFNEKARWGLAIVGITLAALWLGIKRGSLEWGLWTGLSLAVTILAIINASKIHAFWKGLFPHSVTDKGELKPRGRGWAFLAIALTWAAYFIAPFLLYIHGWRHTPFYFLVALLIYCAVRFLSVFAHAVMRLFFGYLRRPVRAICTLLGAFLLGWWGVHVANGDGMLVVDAEPVASLVAPETPEPKTRAEPKAPPGEPRMLYMGSETADDRTFIRDVPCSHLISEPLYALDTLIPLLDLREESRCEVRRHPEEHRVPPAPDAMRGIAGVVAALPALTIHNNAFWQGMKVLYAIAGWFIVSLSILTFAQVNKTHAEPPTEHR